MSGNNFEKRLKTIEGKIDKLTDLITQTQLQEYRLKQAEGTLEHIVKRIEVLEKSTGEKAMKIIATVGGGIVTILLSYIAVKVGVKF